MNPRWVNWMQRIGKGLRITAGEAWIGCGSRGGRMMMDTHYSTFAVSFLFISCPSAASCSLCVKGMSAMFANRADSHRIFHHIGDTLNAMQILKICCDKNLIPSRNVRIRFGQPKIHREFDHWWWMAFNAFKHRCGSFLLGQWRWRFRSTNHCCETLAEIILLYKEEETIFAFFNRHRRNRIGTYFSKTKIFVHIYWISYGLPPGGTTSQAVE